MSGLTGLPVGSCILVTGANGFIASHVINTLLLLEYRVRGTVRTAKPWLDVFFEDKFGRGVFESFVLTDFENPEMLDNCMSGIAGVVHVASDVSFSNDPDTVIPWVVRAVENFLKAASRHPPVKRFVLTSSSAAALVPVTNQKGVRVDEDTWNETAVKVASDPNTKSTENAWPITVYAASKTLSEQMAWNWIQEHSPGFIFNTVLPNFNVGEVLHENFRGSSMGMIRGLLNDNKSIFDFFIPRGEINKMLNCFNVLEHYVDVTDTARLHAIALLAPNIQSQRIFAFAGPLNMTDIILALRELRPEYHFDDPKPNEGQDLTDVAPAAKAEKLLEEFFGQKRWIHYKKSIADGICDL
ncbi:NAD dependent epimerase/dehydratase [Penicillium cf. griseofulvum]|nr:NAD dependent epimerase/dehydratase [Penicillium cf. griseofulvum]